MLATIELSHSELVASLRLVADAADHALPIEGGGTAAFVADVALAVGTPQIDESGRAAVSIQFGDEDGSLYSQLRALRNSAERPLVRLRWFENGLLMLGPVELYLHEPASEGPVISAEARSRDDSSISAQPRVTTLENTPTLRGLK